MRALVPSSFRLAALALLLGACLAAPGPASARVAEIFAGTWGPAGTGQGRVLQYDEGTTWVELSPPGGLADGVWDLAWHEGRLWAATHRGPESTFDPDVPHGTSGHVYRWDGTAWDEVSPPGGFESAATTVSVLRGEVYVTVDHLGLVRWLGGRDWETVAEFELAAQAIVSDSHDGRDVLYLGQDNTDEFWFHDPEELIACGTPVSSLSCQMPTGPVCSADCHPGSCIHAFAEFDDGTGPLVYAGAWQGRMYRWEPASRLFVPIDDIPDAPAPLMDLEHVQGLAPWRGRLWAGISDGKLWSSVDATAATWIVEHDFGLAEPVSEMVAVPQDDVLWTGFGGVPWRWARRDGRPLVRTFDGVDHVVRGQGPLFGQGVLVLLPVVPEIDCDAGAPQVVECAGATTEVTLDGSGTTVTQGFDATYSWAGPFVGGTAEGVTPTVVFEGTGTFAVTLTVTAGRVTESCETTVTIEDTTPPVLAAGSACLWPPNHRYRCFTAGELLALAGDPSSDTPLPAPATPAAATAVDACEGELPVSIVGARSSQPEDSPDRGDGATLDDLLFDAGTVCVRSERLGEGQLARTYTVTLAATDSAGNVASVDATLVVPHDQREERRCDDPAGGVGLLPQAELPLGPDAREGSYP